MIPGGAKKVRTPKPPHQQQHQRQPGASSSSTKGAKTSDKGHDYEANDEEPQGVVAGGGGSRGGGRKVTAPALIDLQDDLSDALQARVRINVGARRGKLQVEFGSIDDLERIVGVIARGLQTDIRVDRG